MKKVTIIYMTVLFALICISCEQTVYSIQLKQAEDEIKSISLFDATNISKGTSLEPSLVICETKEIEDFVSNLQCIELGRYFNDPPTSYGKLYVEILYRNGDVEIIGTDMITYISSDKGISENPEEWYYVKMNSMRELFNRYSGK